MGMVRVNRSTLKLHLEDLGVPLVHWADLLVRSPMAMQMGGRVMCHSFCSMSHMEINIFKNNMIC